VQNEIVACVADDCELLGIGFEVETFDELRAAGPAGEER
jgi:hypothetical protein